METELRGEMTDDAFREKLLAWSREYDGKQLVAISLDTDLGPFEAVAGPGSEVRMGVLAYRHCRTNTLKIEKHELN